MTKNTKTASKKEKPLHSFSNPETGQTVQAESYEEAIKKME